MIDKKKIHFVRLSLIFGVIVLLTLTHEWSKAQSWQTGSSMMSETMGMMMTSMHLKNVNINDLIQQSESQENANSTSMSSHHNAQDSELGRMHYFTTLSIVMLLPFLVAGTIFLSIVWLK